MDAVTRYVVGAGGAHIAYQVVDGGDIALVVGLEPPASLHVVWDELRSARFLRRLASFSTLVLYDRRGFGASDPIPVSEPPPTEELADDLIRILDAVRAPRASLIMANDGGRAAVQAAATSPDRVASLILMNTYARLSRCDDYLIGLPAHIQEEFLQHVNTHWGTTIGIDWLAPSRAADPAYRDWYTDAMRVSQTPGTSAANLRRSFETDVRSVLPSVRVPTLVLHTADNQYLRVAHGRYIADHIPGAQFIELPGGDHALSAMDLDLVADHIEEFVLGAPTGGDRDRNFATVLFTDIVRSTEEAARRGDTDWHALLDQHDVTVQRQLDRFSGRLVKSTGDGILAVFDGPARAIRCALALREALARLGLVIRAGLHAGEIEARGEDIAGIAVHIASRVQGLAQPGEVLVSRTVVDLIAGSGIECRDRGEHALKGVPGSWRVFAVTPG